MILDFIGFIYIAGVVAVCAWPLFVKMGGEESVVIIVAVLWPFMFFVVLPLVEIYDRRKKRQAEKNDSL